LIVHGVGFRSWGFRAEGHTASAASAQSPQSPSPPLAPAPPPPPTRAAAPAPPAPPHPPPPPARPPDISQSAPHPTPPERARLPHSPQAVPKDVPKAGAQNVSHPPGWTTRFRGVEKLVHAPPDGHHRPGTRPHARGVVIDTRAPYSSPAAPANARGGVILPDTTYLLISFRKSTPHKTVNLTFQLVIAKTISSQFSGGVDIFKLIDRHILSDEIGARRRWPRPVGAWGGGRGEHTPPRMLGPPWNCVSCASASKRHRKNFKRFKDFCLQVKPLVCRVSLDSGPGTQAATSARVRVGNTLNKEKNAP